MCYDGHICDRPCATCPNDDPPRIPSTLEGGRRRFRAPEGLVQTHMTDTRVRPTLRHVDQSYDVHIAHANMHVNMHACMHERKKGHPSPIWWGERGVSRHTPYNRESPWGEITVEFLGISGNSSETIRIQMTGPFPIDSTRFSASEKISPPS